MLLPAFLQAQLNKETHNQPQQFEVIPQMRPPLQPEQVQFPKPPFKISNGHKKEVREILAANGYEWASGAPLTTKNPTIQFLCVSPQNKVYCYLFEYEFHDDDSPDETKFFE